MPTTGRLSAGPCSASNWIRSSRASCWPTVSVCHHSPNSFVYSTSHARSSIMDSLYRVLGDRCSHRACSRRPSHYSTPLGTATRKRCRRTTPFGKAAEVTIDQFAHEAGIPTSTVRLYQDRRLLPPPRREGRIGYYSTGHLDRLRLIAHLRGTGHSLAAIKEPLDRGPLPCPSSGR